MKTISNADLKAALQLQQGLELTYLLKISWDGVIDTLYSNNELSVLSDVYPYISAVSSFTSTNMADGLGDSTSATIVFNDFLGHFKEMLDTYDLFDKSASATMYITSDTTIETLDDAFIVLQGMILSPFIWDEGDKTLEITLSNEPVRGQIGYTPTIDDVDEADDNYSVLEENLTGKNWPEVFGTVYYYPVPRFAERAFATCTSNTPMTDDNTTMYIPISKSQFETDDAEANPEVYVNVVGQKQGRFDFILLGRFKTGTALGLPEDVYFCLEDAEGLVGNKILSSWYKNIQCTPVTGDHEITGTLISGKTTLLDLDFESGSPVNYKDEPVTEAWIEYMTGYYSARYTYSEQIATRGTPINIIKQEGNRITVVPSVTYASLAETIDENVLSKVSKTLVPMYYIPEGTKLYLMEDYTYYIIDNKKDTQVKDLYIQTEDGMKALAQATYSIHNNAATTTAASGDWQANTPGADLFTASEGAGVPEEYTYAKISAEGMLRFIHGFDQEDSAAELWCTAKTNSTYTDHTMAYYLLNKYSDRTIDTLNQGTVTPSYVNCAILETEQLSDIAPEILWQLKKAGVITGSTLKIIDLETPTAPIFEFTDGNVLGGSVQFSFTPIEEVVTLIEGQAVGQYYNRDIYQTDRKNNIDKYGRQEYQANFYVYTTRGGVNGAMDFWIDRLSKIRRLVTFKGFLDALVLEPWDRVSINLSDPSFYNVSDGTPLNNYHTGISTTAWQSEGWVRETAIDLADGLVTVTIELDSTVVESPNQPIRPVIVS